MLVTEGTIDGIRYEALLIQEDLKRALVGDTTVVDGERRPTWDTVGWEAGGEQAGPTHSETSEP